MKGWVLAAIVMLAPSAFAKTQPIEESTTLKCEVMQEAVRQNGFKHYTTHGEPKLPHFATYVADPSWCADGQKPRAAQIEAEDTPHCWLGFQCFDEMTGRFVE